MKFINVSFGVCLFFYATMSLASPAKITASADDFRDVMASLTMLRVSYAESVAATGQAPKNLYEIGVSETMIQNALISHVGIDTHSNAIMVGLTSEFGQNEWVALIPVTEDYIVKKWVCQTTVASSLVGNTGCVGGLSYSAIVLLPNAALFTETLAGLSAIQLNYLESYLATGRRPRSLAEVGVDERGLAMPTVSHILIEARRRAILVGLSDVFGKNHWLALVPSVSRVGDIRWRCRTTLSQGFAAGTACQTGLATEQLIR